VEERELKVSTVGKRDHFSEKGSTHMATNPLGKRCDNKMSPSGKLLCIHPGCQRIATVRVTMSGRFLHSFRCASHIGSAAVVQERNTAGFIGETRVLAGFGPLRYTARWQERADSNAYSQV